ncbi:MbtH family NRPS accessory protein [Streptomyces sp. JH14]|uniref:MbtH family protein n=1 Tax=Streptomyces sp. JH14 TaxID=2793630 RepID=UPI0023F66C07|nr:MbtH family NRPS accessory protein [Streptomyces sp. JH14]MDF6045870.1 MbtH family NRPS accessory protein [Streptomyces sp. JH14]
MSDQKDQPVHTVVVNEQEQYSVWPDLVAVPQGWRETGRRGTHAECLEHIESVWTGLRPLSIR